MYKKGEHIMYSYYGGCVIEDIMEKKLGKISKMYYILRPINDSRSTITTPVDNKKVRMRAIISPKEANCIIESLDSLDVLWIENQKVRFLEYKKTIKAGEARELAGLVKVLFQKQMELSQAGRRFSASDATLLDDSEKLLYTELSVALGLDVKELKKQVTEKIKNSTVKAAD